MYVIYKLTDKASGKIYIGMTKNLRHRIACHRSQKGRAMHGLDFDAEIIANAKYQGEAERIEAFWIGLLQSHKPEIGYNELIGRELVDKTRKRMSASQLERWKTEPNPFLGKKHSEETRKIMSEKKRGKRPPSAGWNKRQVKNLDTGEIFESAAIACEIYKIHKASLSRVCLGKQKTAGDCRWQFVDP